MATIPRSEDRVLVRRQFRSSRAPPAPTALRVEGAWSSQTDRGPVGPAAAPRRLRSAGRTASREGRRRPTHRLRPGGPAAVHGRAFRPVRRVRRAGGGRRYISERAAVHSEFPSRRVCALPRGARRVCRALLEGPGPGPMSVQAWCAVR